MAIPRDPARSVVLSDLGFLEDPFRWAPDPRFLFLSSQHRPVLNQLHRTIERERGLAVVDGEHGVGKSAIARRLESYYSARVDEYRVVFISRPEFDSRYATLLGLSRALMLPRRKGIQNQWDELASYLNSEMGEGRIVVILIDDGHKLDPEVFTELDHVAQDLASVVVFGLPEIQLALARVPNVLARSSRATLLPFSLEDAIDLIEFRTHVAGRKEPLFSKDAVEHIWEATKGNPRDIVVICGRVINELGSRGESYVTVDIAEVAVDSYLTSPLTVFRPDIDMSEPESSPDIESVDDDVPEF